MLPLPELEELPSPPPGRLIRLPVCQGSADALLIARLAQRHARESRLLVVVTAAALDAQRLLDECQWFAPDLRLACLSDWETLPYDSLSPHQDLVSGRLATLYELQQRRIDLLLIPATTALHRLTPPAFVAAHTFSFKRGQRLNEASLREQLGLAGYEPVQQVVRPGEYCVRGGLIDLFPMGSSLPYRVDLLDDEIDTLRAFDPDTQRSVYPVDQIRLLPGREFPMDEAARTAFRGRWRERFEGDPSKAGPYRDIGNGIAAPGIEYWLPLFFEQTATLFDHLPSDALLLTHGDVDAAGRQFVQEARQRHAFLGLDNTRPLLRPDELFLDTEAFFIAAKAHGRYALAPGADAEPGSSPDPGTAPGTYPDLAPGTGIGTDPAPAPTSGAPHRIGSRLPPLAIERRADAPVGRLQSWLSGGDDRLMLPAESAGQRETPTHKVPDNHTTCTHVA